MSRIDLYRHPERVWIVLVRWSDEGVWFPLTQTVRRLRRESIDAARTLYYGGRRDWNRERDAKRARCVPIDLNAGINVAHAVREARRR